MSIAPSFSRLRMAMLWIIMAIVIVNINALDTYDKSLKASLTNKKAHIAASFFI
jgi:hypothetical protein